MRKLVTALALAFALTACGGGGSDGGGGSIVGPTTHDGVWTLEATITAIVAGDTSVFQTVSVVDVQSNGAVGILSSDTECALQIGVNGNTLTYRESCIFPGETTTEGDTTSTRAPCTLTMQAVATIITNALVTTGPFGPETLVCSGSAASYSGTLVVTRGDTTTPEPPPTTP